MPDRQSLSPELLLQIAQTLNVLMRGLVAVIELLDEGGTVPFIARYRKEATGNLDEVQIRDIKEKLAYFRDLVARRETIIASIAEQGKLSEELKARIDATFDKSELETSICPIGPSAAQKRSSRAKRGWSHLPFISGHSTLRTNRSSCSLLTSSVRKRVSPTPKRLWKARGTLSRK